MPLQNRVDPWGKLHAVKSRGSFLGNRGKIHNINKEIVTTHNTYGWMTCRLDYKDRKRQIMAPGKYTELFFLDEATAFSAGHRPCAECRRKRYNAFKEKWLDANGELLSGKPPTIKNIDRIIHKERIYRKEKVTYTAKLSSLPDGTIFQIDSLAYIIWKGEIFRWSFSGYSSSNIKRTKKVVEVLTPRSYVQMFSKGFFPEVHESL